MNSNTEIRKKAFGRPPGEYRLALVAVPANETAPVYQDYNVSCIDILGADFLFFGMRIYLN